ncbi:MAG: hypothetical protein IJF32_03630 [Oscillospiraceae bacterium]|nr:hypothetical protein [Oscillospiraceae bacterium]
MKKALSLILAMMLVVGLIPAAFASDAPPAEGYTYVFSNAAHTGSAGNTGSVSFATTMQSIETTDTSVSARWGYVAEAFPVADSSCTDSSQMRLSYYRPNYDINKAVTFDPDMEGIASAVCLELEVTDGGTFVPTLNYASHSLGPIVELYLVPKSDVTTPITNDNLSDFVKKDLDPKYRIGTVDACSGSSLKMRSVELKSNTNCYFIMVPNGESKAAAEYAAKNNKNFHYFLLKSLELKPREGEYEKYDYLFTMNGGIDIDTDGEGSDIGLPVDKNITSSTEAGKSTIGCWENGTANYMLYNAAIPRFITNEYKYINTANSEKWSYGGDNLPASKYINKNGFMMSVGDITDRYFALKLYVENPDTYTMSFQRTNLSYNAEVQFSFFPADKELNSENIAANTVGNNIDLQTANGEVIIGKVTANAAGEYYLVVSYTGYGTCGYAGTVRGAHLKSIHLTATTPSYATEPGDAEVNVNPGNATAKEEATISNEISVLAKDTDGNAVENAVTKSESSATAEKTVGDYEFLYWAKGIGNNQKKVSTDLTYNYTKETEKLWLFAVYRNTKEAAKNATFYNANGDIIATVAIADGKVRTPALTNVSLAGYGAVKGWKYAADGVTYDAGEEVRVTGDALFVAEYDELNTSIDITVENGTMTVEGGKEKPLFGDKVTVTAPARKENTKLFNYWKKGDEIVSFDREYSFCAWEPCTLTAVYTDYVPLADTVRKIILGSVANGTETTYVAEFIGFDGDDVLERGIAFATEGNASYASINRAVMTKKDLNHLAAVNDIGATSVVGYVIDKDGKVYYSK